MIQTTKILILLVLVTTIEANKDFLSCQNATDFLENHPRFNEIFESENFSCNPGNTCLYSNITIGEDTNVSYQNDQEMKTSCIVFTNSSLFELPGNLLENINSTFYEGMYAANLSIMQVTTLNNSHTFQFLNMSYNKLKVLDRPVVKTSHMDFSHNEIHMILNSAFEKFSTLDFTKTSHLDFSHNRLTNFSVEWFDAIDVLKVNLDFSYNLISAISGIGRKQYSDNYLMQMEYRLDLSHNQLNHFPIRLLRFVPRITHLNLSNNRVKSVKSLRKFRMQYIFQFLDLSYNQISKVSLQSFENITASYLDLSHNKIEVISKLDSNFTNGTYKRFVLIDLSHNLITTLPVSMFHRIVADRIILSKNYIRKLEDYQESVDSMIGFLDISHNKIRELSIKAITKIRADVLDLSYNRIHQIGEIEDIRRIETLILNYNFISNIPHGAFTNSTIKDLRLRYNRVFLRHGIFPINVEHLDLRQNNFRHSIQETHFLFYKKLHTLRLEDSGIQHNFLTPSFNVSSIKKLGINQNPFKCEVLKKILKILEACHVDYQIEHDQNIGVPPYKKMQYGHITELDKKFQFLHDENELMQHNKSNINGIECIE